MMVASVGASAQGELLSDATTHMDALRKANNGITTIASNFRQTKHISLMDGAQVSLGQFYYRRADNAVCFNYSEPRDNKMVMNRGTIAISTGGKTQVIDGQGNPAMQQMQAMIAACFGGNFAQMKDKQDVKMYDDGERLTVVLTPLSKRVQRYMSQIVLTFDKQNYQLMCLKMIEKNGDTSEYEFTAVEINKPLDNNIFATE